MGFCRHRGSSYMFCSINLDNLWLNIVFNSLFCTQRMVLKDISGKKKDFGTLLKLITTFWFIVIYLFIYYYCLIIILHHWTGCTTFSWFALGGEENTTNPSDHQPSPWQPLPTKIVGCGSRYRSCHYPCLDGCRLTALYACLYPRL